MLEAENVIDYTEELRRALSPSIRVEYLHGKMKGKEKNAIMEAFAANEIQYWYHHGHRGRNHVPNATG